MPLRFDIESGEFVEVDEKNGDAVANTVAPPTLEEIRLIVAEEVAKIPVPKDGKSVDPADVLKMVMAEVAKIPHPKDGKSVTLDDVKPLISSAVSSIAVGHGKDGVGIADIKGNGGELTVMMTDGTSRVFSIPAGKSVELEATETHVMWRHEGMEWKELFAIPKQKTITGGGGGRTKANIQAMIDAAVGNASFYSTYPIGIPLMIDPDMFDTLPAELQSDSWVEMNGQVINDAESPLDGKTIKNLNGQRFVRGNSDSENRTTGGAATVTLSQANLPNVSFPITDTGHSHGTGVKGGGFVNDAPGTEYGPPGLGTPKGTVSASTASATTGISVGSGGSGTAFSILPPFIDMLYMMRIK